MHAIKAALRVLKDKKTLQRKRRRLWRQGLSRLFSATAILRCHVPSARALSRATTATLRQKMPRRSSFTEWIRTAQSWGYGGLNYASLMGHTFWRSHLTGRRLAYSKITLHLAVQRVMMDIT